jgi:Zn-dependent protease
LQHPIDAVMTRQNIPFGRIVGVSIGPDYSWFMIFALLSWTLAGNYYTAEFKNWEPPLYWVMGAVTALTLFTAVLLHELGHSVVVLNYKQRASIVFVANGAGPLSADNIKGAITKTRSRRRCGQG